MESKTQGSPCAIQDPNARTYMVVIDDYYPKLAMDENMNWMTLTHLFSSNFLTFMTPFCTSTFTLDFYNNILWMYALEKNFSHMYNIYTNEWTFLHSP